MDVITKVASTGVAGIGAPYCALHRLPVGRCVWTRADARQGADIEVTAVFAAVAVECAVRSLALADARLKDASRSNTTCPVHHMSQSNPLKPLFWTSFLGKIFRDSRRFRKGFEISLQALDRAGLLGIPCEASAGRAGRAAQFMQRSHRSQAIFAPQQHFVHGFQLSMYILGDAILTPRYDCVQRLKHHRRGLDLRLMIEAWFRAEVDCDVCGAKLALAQDLMTTKFR